MARNRESHGNGLVLPGLVRIPFLLPVGVLALLILFAAACEGDTDSEPTDTGSGDVAGNTSPEAPITITTYRSPT